MFRTYETANLFLFWDRVDVNFEIWKDKTCIDTMLAFLHVFVYVVQSPSYEISANHFFLTVWESWFKL